MNDVLIVSCRLCLQPDELPSMVTIERLLDAPPRRLQVSICRPCAREIAVTLEELDDFEKPEVQNHASARVDDDRGAGGDSPAAAPIDPLVLSDTYVSPVPELNRLEHEVPAGGSNRERTPEKS